MGKFRFQIKVVALSVAVSLGLGGAANAVDGDADRGAKIYKKCVSCHMVGPDAKKRSGPPLNNIIDAPAGAFADYKYSKALMTAAQDGLVWTWDDLDAFLARPKKFLPRTKMTFGGLRKDQDRADVIAYLATFSDGAVSAAVVAGFNVSPEILSIAGDVEYGEYLASECTTCHRSDGGDDGIPSITGLDTEHFVTALHAYREKFRDNSVMQLVAGRLTDEEIAALAAYFKSLEH